MGEIQICKEGMLVYPTKIVIIFNIPTPMIVKKLWVMVGRTSYYRKFIRVYATITVPMEKLLKKDAKFKWTNEFQHNPNTLDQKMVKEMILVFLELEKEFHLHVDTLLVALVVILAQPWEGEINHRITFAIHKLSIAEMN